MEMTTSRWRGVAALAGAVGSFALLAAMGAPGASADFVYCNTLVQPMTECSNGSGPGFWGYNIAEYDGAGTVSVCERGDLFTGGEISRVCANNFVEDSSTYPIYNAANEEQVLHVGNNSGFAHTIVGHGDPLAHIRRAAAPASLPQALTRAVGALRTADADGRADTLASDGDSVSLQATDDGVCLSSTLHGGVLTCDSAANTVAGDLQGVIVCGPDLAADQIAVYGVVPDGATRVVAVDGPATVASTAVSGNTYRFELSKQNAATVTGFTWTDADGSAHAMSDTLPADLSCDA